MNMQTIQNDSDLQILYAPLLLYLKPLANLTISINLPSNLTGRAISNFEVMDKLRQMILPDNFSLLKVSKTTLELLRFDAELDDRNKLKHVIARLDGRQIKLTGYTDYVKVRAYESKSPFPTKHDWDSFFRDAKHMDEMHAGERPDTIYISNLPIRWFCPRHHENDDSVKPSEVLFKRIFEKFGEVRTVDIPICDPYRDQMKSGLTGLKNFSYDNETYFEGYVQFTEYASFVRCMDDFRAMKLVRKEKDKLIAVNIEVNFDKTKHLSDVSIKRRKVIRERLMEKDRQKADEEEKKLRIEQEKREKEKQKEEVRKQIQAERRRQREERRKQKNIKKITESESSDLTRKIHKEQRKLLKTQRKMESIRLLEAIFDRIKSKFPADDVDGPTKGFKGFDLRKKLKKKKSKNKNHDDDGSQSASSVSSNEINKKKSKKRRDSSASSTASSSSSDESTDHRSKSKSSSLVPHAPNGMFPTNGWMPNPETGEWFPASYMYTPFFPGMVPRPYFNPNYRGNYPRRGRGRGRGGYYGNDGRYYKSRYDDDYYIEHDNRRSYSRSPRRRSHSRSRSRNRSRRRRSYSRSRSRSSRSRSSSHRSRRSRSRSKSHSKRHRSTSKPKLVTTLRDGNTKKTPPTTRRSRSKSNSGWSSDDHSNHKRRKNRSSWSRESSRERDAVEPKALLRSAKEIQRHVQQKLKEQQEEEERKMKIAEKQLEQEALEIEKRMEREANGESIESPQSDKNDQQSSSSEQPTKEKTPILYTPPPREEALTPEITV